MTKSNITLTETEKEDLKAFFEFQLDKEANYLAAVPAKDPNDKAAYIEKCTKHLADPSINMRTIKVNDVFAGSIGKMCHGKRGRDHVLDLQKVWGKGVATRALKEFLENENARPIFPRVAFDNFASQKMLEKCNFINIGKDKGFANSRQAEIEEFIYKLH